nr:conidiophore development regulator abaa [Quercus suber]
MYRSGQFKLDQALALNTRLRLSQADMCQNIAQTGSGCNFGAGLVNNTSTECDRRPFTSQPKTWSSKQSSCKFEKDHLNLATPTRESEQETQAIRTAKNLLRRFKASEQYMKYRNRQQKENRQGQEQKWPDHLEEAFFRALVKYPPMGRRMLLHNGKQRGRNELIADEISQLTGEERSRKQISSHIQVLKPFVKHDSLIMRFLSKDEICESGLHHVGKRREASRSSPSLRTFYRHEPHVHQGPLIDTTSDSIAQRKCGDYIDNFEPTDFQIFIQQRQGNSIQRLHTYTQSVRQTQMPIFEVSDVAMLEQEFPPLSHLHSQTPVTCEVLVADSSLSIPTDTFNDLLGIELGVQLQFRNRHGPDRPVRCDNTFYHDGEPFSEQIDLVNDVATPATDDLQDFAASVKFGSTFWAKHLSHLNSIISHNGQYDMNVVKEDIATYISSITALQQILMPDDNGIYKPVLVVFWTFRHSSEGRGLTTWSKLILPQPSAQHGLRSLGSAYEFGRPDRAVARDTHRVPLSSDHEVMPFNGYHMPPHLALPASYEVDTTSPRSVMSSYTWPTTFSDSPINWSNSDTNDTFDLPSRNVNFGFDPLLGLSNSDNEVRNTSGSSTVRPAIHQHFERCQQSWVPTDVIDHLPMYAGSDYDSDTHYAYDDELIPAMAQMDCSKFQQEHHANSYEEPSEEPYGCNLASASQMNYSRSQSRDVSQCFSPHSSVSPTYEEISTFPDLGEHAIPPDFATSHCETLANEGGPQVSRPLQYIPPCRLPIHRRPSRLLATSLHKRALSETTSFNFELPPSQF